jgi:hypothetical protein
MHTAFEIDFLKSILIIWVLERFKNLISFFQHSSSNGKYAAKFKKKWLPIKLFYYRIDLANYNENISINAKRT